MNIEKYKEMIEEVTEEPNNMSSDWVELLNDFADLLKRQRKAEEERAIMFSALNTFGAAVQTIIAFEEMSELQKELCKNARGKDNKYLIAEEIADVQIMLDQMILLYGVRGEVNRQRALKLERLNERVEEAKNGERVS